MTTWRLFYWARLLLILFAVFIVATAVFDVSLAPDAPVVERQSAVEPDPASDVSDVEIVVHEGGTDKVGGWLSRKVDGGLGALEDIRREVRDVGSSIGDRLGL